MNELELKNTIYKIVKEEIGLGGVGKDYPQELKEKLQLILDSRLRDATEKLYELYISLYDFNKS